MNPNKVDVIKQTKVLCDGTQVDFGPEAFLLTMICGTESKTYGLTPKHAKTFWQSFQNSLNEYEKQFGKIDAQWQPGMPSPIQTSDLNQGKDKKGKR